MYEISPTRSSRGSSSKQSSRTRKAGSGSSRSVQSRYGTLYDWMTTSTNGFKFLFLAGKGRRELSADYDESCAADEGGGGGGEGLDGARQA